MSPLDHYIDSRLPWDHGVRPLMLAPMQGLTNQAMRALFINWVRPDVVFTEFMRVSGVSRKRLSPKDLKSVTAEEDGVPLVVQLIGHDSRSLVEAAELVQEAGARHINLNLGCPYGRMTTAATGGKLLQRPVELAKIVLALRNTVTGSFSIKLRAGYDNPQQIFPLVQLFETAGVDFLILHPRTVLQEYKGQANHDLTSALIKQCRLPVIANGDIRTAKQGLDILAQTKAAGLMIGRGAIADPLLFNRLRLQQLKPLTKAQYVEMLQQYLKNLLEYYSRLFCGEAQTLSKIKNVLTFLDNSFVSKEIKRLKKTRSLKEFSDQLSCFISEP